MGLAGRGIESPAVSWSAMDSSSASAPRRVAGAILAFSADLGPGSSWRERSLLVDPPGHLGVHGAFLRWILVLQLKAKLFGGYGGG